MMSVNFKEKMSMDLKDYVKFYDFLDKNFCDNLVKSIQDNDWNIHTYHSETDKILKSYDTDLSVCLDQNLQQTKIINEKMWNVLNDYIRKDFSYMNDWFSCWNGYSYIRYNRYDVDKEMKLHCDHIQTLFDGSRRGIPTLSILGALNDDYEGGELVFWETEVMELKAGQIMVFPSNFLYPHLVRPVTRGTRYSFVSWCW